MVFALAMGYGEAQNVSGPVEKLLAKVAGDVMVLFRTQRNALGTCAQAEGSNFWAGVI